MATRRVSIAGRGLWEEEGGETGRRGRAGQRGRSYNQELWVVRETQEVGVECREVGPPMVNQVQQGKVHSTKTHPQNTHGTRIGCPKKVVVNRKKNIEINGRPVFKQVGDIQANKTRWFSHWKSCSRWVEGTNRKRQHGDGSRRWKQVTHNSTKTNWILVVHREITLTCC